MTPPRAEGIGRAAASLRPRAPAGMMSPGAQAEDLLSAPSPGDALVPWLHAVLVHTMTQRGLKEALMNDAGPQLISACKGAHAHCRGLVAGSRASSEGYAPQPCIADLLWLVHGI